MADVFADYAESDGRQDRSTRYVLAGVGQASNADDASSVPVAMAPILWIEAGVLEPVGPALRRCRMGISSRPDFDRLFQVMTDPRLNGRLEVA